MCDRPIRKDSFKVTMSHVPIVGFSLSPSVFAVNTATLNGSSSFLFFFLKSIRIYFVLRMRLLVLHQVVSEGVGVVW